MIKINFVNNNGGGFAAQKEIPEEMTIGEFAAREGIDNPDAFLIRVNGKPVRRSTELASGDDVEIASREGISVDAPLNEGDRLTATPTQIKGATN